MLLMLMNRMILLMRQIIDVIVILDVREEMTAPVLKVVLASKEKVVIGMFEIYSTKIEV